VTFWELAGLCDARRVPKIPIEIALARKALRHRMSFTVPGIFALGLMQARTQPRGWARRLVARAAEAPALAYFRQLQRFDGYAGGFEESPLLAGVVLMALARAGLLPQVNRRCRGFLLETRRGDGSWAVDRDLELTASTAVVMGLQEAGFAGDGRLTPTLYRLLSAQRPDRCPGTGVPAGGWSWAMPSGWPDVDDTAAALTVLPGWGARAAAPAMVTGVDWLLDMQRRDGSWGCFVTRGTVDLDGPCPILAAHALEGLRASGRLTVGHPRIRRAFTALGKAQRPDGSFGSLWYRPHTLGTAAVLTAYGKYGLRPTTPARRAADWLLATQLPDGGWGDGTDRKPTVEETAWALHGLLESGHPPRSDALARAADWLVRRQTPEGGWTPAVVGVYFPGLYYSDDHVANGYALRALAAYRRRLKERP
jgi:squalene-hopene/tetraprenyl-beta-curcumene cyclase